MPVGDPPDPGSNLAAPPHTLAAAEVAARLEVRPDFGLTSAQARLRNAQCGPNRLPEAPTRSAWLVFFGQFKSILILILIGAALLAALIGNVKDAVVILAVVVINAVVGFYQEYRAEQSLAALKGMLPVRTRVRRDGEKRDIAAEDLVPGDVCSAGGRRPRAGRRALVHRCRAGDRRIGIDGRVTAGRQADRRPGNAGGAPRRPGQHGLHEHDAHARARGTHRHRHWRAYRDGAAFAGTCCGRRRRPLHCRFSSTASASAWARSP